MIDLIIHSQSLYLLCVAIFGLIMGSFLNVVILRYPKMLAREWSKQCVDYLQESKIPFDPVSFPKHNDAFNLVWPASHCPHCKRELSAFENIPVVSFLFLKGRCRSCQQPISWRYPVIEIYTALFSVITAYHFGFSWTTLAALIFTLSLIVLTVIDIEHQILPDDITLPLLWLGLFINIFPILTDITSAVVGAIAGYLFLWSIYWGFKLLTKKEGMGYGDFKLLAMLGAWLGWQMLPQIILISSAAGACVGVILMMFKKHSFSRPMPFGPYLAFAGWVSLIWGQKINDLYLSLSGLQ